MHSHAHPPSYLENATRRTRLSYRPVQETATAQDNESERPTDKRNKTAEEMPLWRHLLPSQPAASGAVVFHFNAPSRPCASPHAMLYSRKNGQGCGRSVIICPPPASKRPKSVTALQLKGLGKRIARGKVLLTLSTYSHLIALCTHAAGSAAGRGNLDLTPW